MIRLAVLIGSLLLVAPIGAGAQPADPPAKEVKPKNKGKSDRSGDDNAGARGGVKERKGGKERLFDFTGLELGGSMRMPQLLYFLERAQEELERASLKRRSFIPEMVRSLDEDAL